MTETATPKAHSPRDARPAAQRVLDAAKELFYRQGIRATGVEEVCRVAGTTKMSLYRAFPSKDALVEAILREDCAEEEDWYGPVLCGSMPARDRPMAFLRQAAKAMRSPGFRGCPMGLAIVEFPDPDHPARQVADARKHAMRELLRALCAEAGAAEPDIAGDSMLLLLEGAFCAVPYLGGEAAARALEQAGEILLGAILPEGAPAAEPAAASAD
ncbi:TetR/AcrR family transcriptional regulator [Pseudoroseomonas cervicalis]|uniref:TetR/AcrR family transcriptional regulator n=1 Tax=Teichococcus cervicalis TaxID=204525 RepID=UPI00278A1873|nr:TetR/AcrR family transcriptional regulator [Pseudoroseomonas cervicalis]MDQ1080649.1 AcrR family transcriptional regulator [Pseudoroseomonas cervicalis]